MLNFHTNLPLISTAVALVLISLAGCGSSPSTTAVDERSRDAGAADTAPPVVNPRDIKLAEDQVVTLTIQSTPAGCMVFVDMVPVRNDNEAMILTPCEVAVPRGMHAISVERPGGRRDTQQLDFKHDQRLEFDVSSSPSQVDDPAILNAPLFEASIGRAIPLATLNTPDQELEPFLSPDARTIYFVSDRGGIRGVYSASRPSPYHDFDEPKVILASSGADLPVSPSVSADGLILVYAVPEKSRLWQLTRADVEAKFDNKEITRSDEKGERAWRSSQLSGDGLRLYWTEESDNGLITRAAVRTETRKLFGKTLAFDLPGQHPHLSSDGLRQFTFDGAKLQRCRRGSIRQPFDPPEVVAELQPDGYDENPQFRQFWVTDDEQWLFYCNNPRKAGDLFVVRLSDGPGWGRTYVGKSVADTMNVAAVEPEVKPKPETTPTDTVDPRSKPLPYTTHWAQLVKLLEARKGDEAVALVKKAQGDPKHSGDRELLQWDLQLAEALAGFDQDVLSGVASLKPGAPVRISGTKFEFNRYEDGILHLKLKDKDVTKKLNDVSPGERIILAEAAEKADAAKSFRFGVFLYFQGKLQHSVAEGWFKKAEAAGEQFPERLAARVLSQANAELARGNVGAGITFLDSVASAAGPDTNAAKQAQQKRNTLYDAIEWKAVGPRKWGRGEQGEFIADNTRSNGSYLKSEQSYGDFEFSCEWRVNGAAAMGGAYIRYSGEGKPSENGAKVHLANDSDLKKMDRFATGALFATTSPSQNASLPEGRWNTLRIQAKGTSVQVWINDKEVLQATLDKDVPASGFVMLDGVAGGIAYRKVLLYELTPAGDQ